MPLYTRPSATDYLPGQSGLLTTGEEIFDREFVSTVAATIGGGTGCLMVSYFVARKTETIGQIQACTGTTAAAATPTLCRMGIYAVNSSFDGTSLLAACASDTTLFAATNTLYSRNLTSSFSKVAGTRYAFTILVVSGAAVPTFHGSPAMTTNYSVSPPLAARSAGGAFADLPASFTYAGVNGGTPARLWGAFLP